MRSLKVVTTKHILQNTYLKSTTTELLKLSFLLSYLEKQIESSFLLCIIIYFATQKCHVVQKAQIRFLVSHCNSLSLKYFFNGFYGTSR